MQITLTDIGKRYNYEWIFRGIRYEFNASDNYAILGSNGSGKSTLLQLIAGNMLPSQGSITYVKDNQTLDPEHIYQQLSFASPYLELLEEFTLKESILFHSRFKHFYNNLNTAQVLALMQLEKAADKQLKFFSSGMKQRVRLALAILSDTPLLLLDEPCSNLDKNAIRWYQELVQAHSGERLIIVASNQLEYEYPFCKTMLNVEDFKKAGDRSS